MSKMLPYQVLMQDKGLSRAELPASVKNDIKALERVLRGVSSFGKTDENGDYIISQSTQDKITARDKAIIDGIYDYLEQKQSKEMTENEQKQKSGSVDTSGYATGGNTANTTDNGTTNTSTTNQQTTETSKETATTETVTEKSRGTIGGFFDF